MVLAKRHPLLCYLSMHSRIGLFYAFYGMVMYKGSVRFQDLFIVIYSSPTSVHCRGDSVRSRQTVRFEQHLRQVMLGHQELQFQARMIAKVELRHFLDSEDNPH